MNWALMALPKINMLPFQKTGGKFSRFKKKELIGGHFI
jgi:hypothetical protein